MLSSRLLSFLPVIALGLVFAFALWHDVRSRRIPNQLIVAGTISAFLLHMMLAPGSGLFSTPFGSLGLGVSLSGFVVGLLLLLPFYAMRALGAGDVKLMAVVGAFIGPFGVLGATLLTMLAGGALALIVAFGSGQLLQVIVNVQQMLRGASLRRLISASARIEAPVATTGKLPYAIAIACGTASQLILASASEWRFFT